MANSGGAKVQNHNSIKISPSHKAIKVNQAIVGDLLFLHKNTSPVLVVSGIDDSEANLLVKLGPWVEVKYITSQTSENVCLNLLPW